MMDAKQKCNKNVTKMYMQILVSVVSNNICKDASHYGGSSEKMKFWFQQEILDAISLFCNIFQCRCYQNK
jgi:hypothetical protein